MESFNDLLLKLREVHEQEVEGWQIKFQELSNKKGCDTKRMEELFTRNQQMKEQQRLLTDNIKTLENRLRAGLCDRCTVTQEVAKRREQEFEVSQLQSIQHITLMAGEITNLKMENKKLREEVKNLKVAKKALTDHSSSSTMIEVKPNNSPISSPSSGPVPLVTTASSRSCSQTSDGIDGRAKIEADQRTEDAEHKQSRGMSRSQFDSYRPLSVSNLASSCNVTRSGERRVQSFEGLDQRSPISAQALLLRNSPSSNSGEVNPSRHVLHSPVPCRPQPLRSHHVALPWPLSESPDWLTVGAAGTNQVMQNSSNPNLPRFPNLIPTTHHATPRRQVYASPWPRQGSPQPPVRESTVVFRLKSMSEQLESQSKPQEKKETQPIKAERVSGEGLREMCEGPLDLSDRGKSKSNQTARDDSPLALQGDDRTLMSPGKDVKINPSANTTLSLPSPVTSPSSSSTPPAKQEEEQTTSDQNHKQVIKDQEKQEEVNGKTEQSNEKKVPVLTISLRPVVVLETLKQDALSSNDTSSSPAANPESSSVELLSAEEESISEPESSQGSKRKRASVETETEQDSDTENTQRERRVKITIRAEEKTPS